MYFSIHSLRPKVLDKYLLNGTKTMNVFFGILTAFQCIMQNNYKPHDIVGYYKNVILSHI